MLFVAVFGIAVLSFVIGWTIARATLLDTAHLGVETWEGRVSRFLVHKENASSVVKGLSVVETGRANTTAPRHRHASHDESKPCLSRAFAIFCQYSRSKRKEINFEECLRSPERVWQSMPKMHSALQSIVQAQSAGPKKTEEDDDEDDDEEEEMKIHKTKASAHWTFLRRVASMKSRSFDTVKGSEFMGS